MPIRITDLVTGTRKITIEFGENSLNLTYDPNKMTIDHEANEIALRQQSRHVQAMAETLSTLIVDWDLLDASGKQLPPSKEVIEGLGWPVMIYLNKKIGEDFYPDPLGTLGRN